MKDNCQKSPAGSRVQTRGEEIANALSHGIGFLGALAAAPLLVTLAARKTAAAEVTALIIFLITVALMYLASTIYHALPINRAKKIFRLLDHCAIYLLIAGTYTPFIIGLFSGGMQWGLLALIWAIALGGIIMKTTLGLRYPKVSLFLYLAMGWLVVVLVAPLWRGLAGEELLFLAAGGLAYTGGVFFYAKASRLCYGHFIWHLFVMTGTVFHLVAVFLYLT